MSSKMNYIMNSAKTLRALELRTGRAHTAKIIKETKCYYTIEIKNYYLNGNSLVERIHKNTMYIDYLDITFKHIGS